MLVASGQFFFVVVVCSFAVQQFFVSLARLVLHNGGKASFPLSLLYWSCIFCNNFLFIAVPALVAVLSGTISALNARDLQRLPYRCAGQ